MSESTMQPSDTLVTDPAPQHSGARSSIRNQKGKLHTPVFNIFGSIQSIAVYAFLLASLFTLFTPNNLFSGQMLNRVFQAWQADPTTVAPLVNDNITAYTGRIGIVSGHWKNDSGAVCADGLT
jgi:hypothetical protein